MHPETGCFCRAAEIDLATDRIDQVLRDGQTQTTPLLAAGIRRLSLHEWLKDVGAHGLWDWHSTIGDRDPRLIGNPVRANPYGPAGIRILDRIRQQVEHHLLEPAVGCRCRL